MNVDIGGKEVNLLFFKVEVTKLAARFENIIQGHTLPYNGGPRKLIVDVRVELPDRETQKTITLDFTVTRDFWPHQKVEEEIKHAMMLVLEHEVDEQLFVNGKRAKDPHAI